MISSKAIKRRIKSAKNISQITKAMQMVSAAKMKKAQAKALAGKPYADKIQEAVMEFASTLRDINDPLFEKHEGATKNLVILVSTNKGLCGGLNTNLFRSTAQLFTKGTTDFITVGKKGRNFSLRFGEVKADFSDQLAIEAVGAIIQMVIEEYTKGNYKSVWIVYNEFISALRYEPRNIQILPFELPVQTKQIEQQEDEMLNQFVIEPSQEEVLRSLIPHYIETQMRRSVLESEASEHSARMIAMKNATDNAKGLMEILSLEYNKIRQQQITLEIADMVTARMSVE